MTVCIVVINGFNFPPYLYKTVGVGGLISIFMTVCIVIVNNVY